jgi:hypothetical protein
MTTSDKITHVVDVVFLVGIIVLVVLFQKANNEQEKEILGLKGTIDRLEGRVMNLENKSGKSPATKVGEG